VRAAGARTGSRGARSAPSAEGGVRRTRAAPLGAVRASRAASSVLDATAPSHPI
jgi:hypothetical protein